MTIWVYPDTFTLHNLVHSLPSTNNTQTTCSVNYSILSNKGADFELKEMFWFNYLSHIINFIKQHKINLAPDDKHLKGIGEILLETRLNKTRKISLVENIFCFSKAWIHMYFIHYSIS